MTMGPEPITSTFEGLAAIGLKLTARYVGHNIDLPMRREIRAWFKQAEYDLGVAKAMLKARKYPYVVFMSHLAVEKALKGKVTEVHQRLAPKTHELVRLAEMANLELTPEQSAAFDKLTRLTLEATYPVLNVRFTGALARELLKVAEDTLSWLQPKKTSPE